MNGYMQVKSKERDISLDFVRGMGMILVVLGHSLAVYTDFIYLFHVPVFFIVSGALFKSTGNVRADLLKKWKRLYIPNLKYGIIFLLLHNIFVCWGIYDAAGSYEIKDYLKAAAKILCFGNEEMGGAMWFLRSLFFAYCLFLVYAWMKRRLMKASFVILVLCLGWYMVYTGTLFPLRTFITIPCIIFPFILIGGG